MGTNRVKYRLRSTESQTSVNTDTFINVQLQGNERLLPTGDINEVVDAGIVFNEERQRTTKYRIIGTVKPIMSNVLFNITGANSWMTFNGGDFKDDPYDNDDTGLSALTYVQSYTKHLKEQDGWFGYYDPSLVTTGACDFITMEPQKRRFSLKPDVLNGNVKNWEMTVTYPWSADTSHALVSGSNSGLTISGFDTVNIGGRWVIVFATPVRHNLKQGDRVRLVGLTPTTFNGDYRVIRTGLDDGSNMEYYFSVNIDFYPVTIQQLYPPVNSNISLSDPRVRRLVAGQESTYYLRLFKKITTVNTNINNGIIEDDDYEIYPTAFAKTVYRDEVCQFSVNEDIEVKDLVDNLGRPLSEIYITFIKTKAGHFTDIKSGLECGLVEGGLDLDIPDIRRIHNDVGSLPPPTPPLSPPYPQQQNPFTSPLPLEVNVLGSDDYFYGDIVEYNRFECMEYVLAEVGHRFNTINREQILSPLIKAFPEGPRLEGYYYLPHHKIKIRDFSNYVEQGDTNTFGIPDYAEDLGDGRWLWRDLLDIGINDGQYETLNYPFLNGAHYLYQNFCFPLRRQDPFGVYDLYYGDNDGTRAPYDIIGRGRSNNFKVNLSEDAC